MENVYKMFKVKGFEAWIVHNEHLEVSKRFISSEGARKYKNKMNLELSNDAVEKEGEQ